MQLNFGNKNKVKTPHWRPDFREKETLPDIKPIRTGFLLNSVGSIALIVAIIAAVSHQGTLKELNTELSTLQGRIDSNNRANRAAIQNHNEFQSLARLTDQVVAFSAQRIDPVAVLIELAQNRPESLMIENVSLTPTVTRVRNRDVVQYSLSIQGTVRDSMEQDASAAITAYRNSLASLPSLEPVLESTRLSSFARSQNPAVFNFAIQVALNPNK